MLRIASNGKDFDGFEKLAAEYIKYKGSKRRFDLNKEQTICDLLQLQYAGKTKCDYCTTLEDSLKKNREYIDPDEAEERCARYISAYKHKPITSSELLDRFSWDISSLKLSNRGMIPKKYVDFIIAQSMMPDSCLNMLKEQYGYLIERAIEDLAKYDYMEHNHTDSVEYAYLTRDYIGQTSHAGLCDWEKKNIWMKRDSVEELFYGDTDILNTIFHENEHMVQHNISRIKNPESIGDYNMWKEYALINCVEGYYQRNYANTYIEIDAREKAAERVAAYLANILPQEELEKRVAEMPNEISRIFLEELAQEKKRNREVAKGEHDLYDGADVKKDSDGQERSIHEIFKSKLSALEIAEMIKRYPVLAIEYKEDGTRRTLPELLAYAEKCNLNPDVMQEIVSASGLMKETLMSEGVGAIIAYYNKNDKDKGKMESFKKFILKNMDGFIGYNLMHLDKIPKTFEHCVKMYCSLMSICKASSIEGNAASLIFNNEKCADSGKTPIQLIQDYLAALDEKYPGIGVQAKEIMRKQDNADKEQPQGGASSDKEKKEKKDGIFTSLFGKKGYPDLKKVSENSDVMGKGQVQKIEKNRMRADDLTRK